MRPEAPRIGTVIRFVELEFLKHMGPFIEFIYEDFYAYLDDYCTQQTLMYMGPAELIYEDFDLKLQPSINPTIRRYTFRVPLFEDDRLDSEPWAVQGWRS